MGLSSAAAGQDIVDHPKELEFEPLEFTPPEPSEFRHELPSGIPVYMAPSDEFPLVTITLSFKGGAYMEPADQAGLAAITGAMVRTGGSAEMTPGELDEEFDFLAADVSVGVGDRTANASINTLTDNLDRSFELFMDMIRNPRFDQDRLDVLKGQSLEGLEARNDDGIGIALREMNYLMWGEDHFEARQPTRESIESVTREDLKEFHQRIFNPANLMIAVTGDFEEREMLSFLEEAMRGWSTGEEAPEIPEPEHTIEPGVYYYEKDQPQVQVLIGHRGIERDNPDAIAVNVMNDILGGAGFTSRITNSVRTREGLAYTAGSVMQPRVGYPGMFMSYFFTKVPTTALATRLVFEEIERIRAEEVTGKELETIQNNLIETFPRNFESKSAMMRLFINDERTDRPEGYWQSYRYRVRAVDAAAVLEAANEYLHPEDMVILVVGPWEQIRAGNADSEGDEARVATMEEFFEDRATEIPQRDPESLEPIE
ncbi:MAG: pitrilysin family protein [Phycisphaerales bacterium]